MRSACKSCCCAGACLLTLGLSSRRACLYVEKRGKDDKAAAKMEPVFLLQLCPSLETSSLRLAPSPLRCSCARAARYHFCSFFKVMGRLTFLGSARLLGLLAFGVALDCALGNMCHGCCDCAFRDCDVLIHGWRPHVNDYQQQRFRRRSWPSAPSRSLRCAGALPVQVHAVMRS